MQPSHIHRCAGWQYPAGEGLYAIATRSGCTSISGRAPERRREGAERSCLRFAASLGRTAVMTLRDARG